MVCAAERAPLPPIAFLMLMTRTIKTLIAIASTSMLVGTFPAVAGANPVGFTNEPDPGFNAVFKPLPRGVKINELIPSSTKGFISEPDVGTFLPKAKNQHMYFPRLPSRTKGFNSIDREPFPRIPSKRAKGESFPREKGKGIFSIDREPILRSPIKRANRLHSYPVTEW